MNYAEIKYVDTANSISIGVSLFVSGCRNRCKGCFNQEAWDFDYGNRFTDDTINEILAACDKSYISTLTILGGDPMEVENRNDILKLCRKFREKFLDVKQLWMYTGYYFEDLIRDDTSYSIIRLLDVLVDSPFILEKKVLNLRLRGSTNQRIIDVKKSLNYNSIILFNVDR